MNKHIDITDPKYDFQTPLLNDKNVLMAGEVYLTHGYHADLLLTLRHEATVLTCCFSPDSAILATGSFDATCRLWSSWKGDLLFQINTPAPIQSIYITPDQCMYVGCQSHFLKFEYSVKLRPQATHEFM